MEFCGDQTSRESSPGCFSTGKPMHHDFPLLSCAPTTTPTSSTSVAAVYDHKLSRDLHGTEPILFLDVDGVLTTSRGLLMNYAPDDVSLYHVDQLLPSLAEHSISPIERDRVKNLSKVVNSVPQLLIVISSTWREDDDYMAFLIAALAEGGIDVDAVVVDSTPVLPDIAGRGAEVREWLAFHPTHEVFAIVDDGHFKSFAECGLSPRLVKTYIGCSADDKEGLTDGHAAALIQLLNNHENPTTNSNPTSDGVGREDMCDKVPDSLVTHENDNNKNGNTYQPTALKGAMTGTEVEAKPLSAAMTYSDSFSQGARA